MAYGTVTTVTGTGKHRALCSCGWESEDYRAKRDAYRANAHHQREHEQGGPDHDQS